MGYLRKKLLCNFLSILPLCALIFSVGTTEVIAKELSIGKVDVSGFLDFSTSWLDAEEQESRELATLESANLRMFSQIDDKTTVQVRLAGGDEAEFGLEQANVNYQVTEALSIFAGEYLSSLGWEAYHAPNRYQYSMSAALVYPAFFSGAGARYQADGFELYGSMAAGIWDAPYADTRTDDIGWEAALRYTAIDNLTVFVGAAKGKVFEDAEFERSLVNLWVSYLMGGLTLAAEYNDLRDYSLVGDDGSSWLVMANYAINDVWGITVRSSAMETHGGIDTEKYTVAGTRILTNNITARAEYNTTRDQMTNIDSNNLVIEILVEF